MTGSHPAHSDKVLAAVMAAVQAYLDQEAAPARKRKTALDSAPLSFWKTVRWNVLRTSVRPERKDPWRFGA